MYMNQTNIGAMRRNICKERVPLCPGIAIGLKNQLTLYSLNMMFLRLKMQQSDLPSKFFDSLSCFMRGHMHAFLRGLFLRAHIPFVGVNQNKCVAVLAYDRQTNQHKSPGTWPSGYLAGNRSSVSTNSDQGFATSAEFTNYALLKPVKSTNCTMQSLLDVSLQAQNQP